MIDQPQQSSNKARQTSDNTKYSVGDVFNHRDVLNINFIVRSVEVILGSPEDNSYFMTGDASVKEQPKTVLYVLFRSANESFEFAVQESAIDSAWIYRRSLSKSEAAWLFCKWDANDKHQ